jgi:hypothetical protein
MFIQGVPYIHNLERNICSSGRYIANLIQDIMTLMRFDFRMKISPFKVIIFFQTPLPVALQVIHIITPTMVGNTTSWVFANMCCRKTWTTISWC